MTLRNLALLSAVAALCACSDAATTSPGDADVGADPGDAGPDGDLADGGPDALAEGLIVSAPANSVALADTLELTATAWADGAPVAERTPIRFEVTSGAAWLDLDGSSVSLQSTTRGAARTRLLPGAPGAVEVTATAALSGGREVSGTLDVMVTGTLQDPLVSLEADLDGDTFFAGGEALAVTIAVTNPQGRPGAGITLAATTSAGELATSTGGPWALAQSPATDARGVTYVYFEPRTFRGPVSLEVRVPEPVYGTAVSGRLTFTVVEAAELVIESVTPERIGVVGAGYPESADVAMRLRTRSGDPVTGAELRLSLETAIDASLSADAVTTDAAGLASATVDAGTQAGPFRVLAETTVDDLAVTARSGLHYVLTGVPVTRYSSLSCTPSNLGGLVDLAPEEAPTVTTHCTGSLRDRLQLPLGLARTVWLEAEVGSVPASVESDESGAFDFDWVLDARPAEVPPFRDGFDIEPLFDPGEGVESNPRDLAARVIFYTGGEELFTDDDENGLRGGGEAFFEQAEPFVDADDDGFGDAGEAFVDAPWGSVDTWDDGNGQWDAETLVWGAALVTLSGDPAFGETGPGSDRETYSEWRAGTPVEAVTELRILDNRRPRVRLLLADRWGAPPNPSTTVTFALEGCGDALAIDSEPVVSVPDGLGFDVVTIQTPIDVGWRLRETILGFEGGATVFVDLDNPPRGDTADCLLQATVAYGGCPDCETTQQVLVDLPLSVE